MDNTNWKETFAALYHSAVERYRAGKQKPELLFTPSETRFLQTIGATPQEIFDFVEDEVDCGEPDLKTVLEITSLRRDYFLQQQKGSSPAKKISMEDLPAKTAELKGITWFPRIIAKARAKLRGEMPSDLMYGCGGDRNFLRQNNLSAEEFLRVVRDAGEDNKLIVDYVLKRRGVKAG